MSTPSLLSDRILRFGLCTFLLLGSLAATRAASTPPTPITPAAPTLGAFTIPAKVYGSAPFAIKPATSPSKGTWGYASSDTTVATVSGSQITIAGIGTTTITAYQAAAGNYLAASTTTTFTVNPAAPKLGTFMIPTQRYGGSPITIIPPTSTSPGAWSYESSNSAVATVSGATLTVTGVGSTVITATQAATGNYASARKSTTFKVTPGTPVLGPFVIPIQSLVNKSFTITPPTSSSTGAWSFNCAKPSIAWVSGTTVTLVGAGTAIITAKQAATVNWLAAQTNATLVLNPPTTDTFGTGSNQFTIAFVPIGNPGNSNDTTGYGGVPYTYRMGKYTISQNQIDAAVSNGLQNVTAGPWSGDQPAANISWYQAAAYVNWLNTSKGYQPAYNLTLDSNNGWSMALWPTTPDSNGNVAWTNGGTNLYRNANCLYFLPSEDEWYKAAYYDPAKNRGSGGYWLYPTGRDSDPTPVARGTNAGTAVYNQSLGNGPASVFQAGGLSPYGTMGQGGNVWSWTETSWSTSNADPQEFRVVLGGGWYNSADYLQSSFRDFGFGFPDSDRYYVGFRVARKP
jgi:formylglycine-generating enzyme required for sulfatase activity